MKILQITSIIVTSLLLFSCKSEKEELKEHKTETPNYMENNLNISILLDLSDRISPEKYPNSAMEFYQRDIGYINSIAETFTNHIKTKKIIQVNDRIQLYFEPEPLNPEINSISNKLKFFFTKENISKESLKKITETYLSETHKIYELAIKDKNYIGSDTWKFFKNNVNDYCINDGYRNILVILTDGYMYHVDTKIKESNKTTFITPETIRNSQLVNSNWSQVMKEKEIGFIKANNDLSNLEVLVLGINPDVKNPYEEDVIKAYWINWLTEMKVKKFDVKKADLPSNMDKVIKGFILKN